MASQVSLAAVRSWRPRAQPVLQVVAEVRQLVPTAGHDQQERQAAEDPQDERQVLVLPRDAQHHHAAEERREAVEHQRRPPRVEPQAHQQVMDVPPVGRAQRQVADPSPEDRHRRVGDRQAHRHDREEDRDRRRASHRPLHADHADQEADQHAAAVAEEDAGRVPVIEQEPRQAARPAPTASDRGLEVLVVDRHQRQRPADQQPHARRPARPCRRSGSRCSCSPGTRPA